MPFQNTFLDSMGDRVRGSDIYGRVHLLPWLFRVSASFFHLHLASFPPPHYFSSPCLETHSWPCPSPLKPYPLVFPGDHNLIFLGCSHFLELESSSCSFVLEMFWSSPGFSSFWPFHWFITFTTVLSTHSVQLISVFLLPLLANS